MMGIYGLVAFSVSQRQREIGVRKAIGATTADIVRLIGGRNRASQSPPGSPPASRLGLLGARGLGSFIVGVSAYDPLTIVAAMALVVAATAAASAIPALRAARVDALRALKSTELEVRARSSAHARLFGCCRHSAPPTA